MFEVLSTEDVLRTVWETVTQMRLATAVVSLTEEAVLAECVNNILKRALIAGSEDNVSALLVSFIPLL